MNERRKYTVASDMPRMRLIYSTYTNLRPFRRVKAARQILTPCSAHYTHLADLLGPGSSRVVTREPSLASPMKPQRMPRQR